MKNTKIEWCDHKRISRMAYERNGASIMNKNINDRIEYLRDVLIAMINEHTGNGIDPLDCLRRNIAKLADRQERGVIKGNGDER